MMFIYPNDSFYVPVFNGTILTKKRRMILLTTRLLRLLSET